MALAVTPVRQAHPFDGFDKLPFDKLRVCDTAGRLRMTLSRVEWVRAPNRSGLALAATSEPTFLPVRDRTAFCVFVSCEMVWLWFRHVRIGADSGDGGRNPPQSLSCEELGERFEHGTGCRRIELTEPFHEPGFVHCTKLIEHHLPGFPLKLTLHAGGVFAPFRRHRRDDDGGDMSIHFVR